MKIIRLTSWEHYEPTIKKLQQGATGTDVNQTYKSTLIFRGVENACWKLETTLERWGHREMEVKNYLECARKASVEVPYRKRSALDWKLSQPLKYPLPEGLPNIEFLAYLRHHGFPSPLMDWSKCALTAAFFAFQRPSTKPQQHAAVFVYQEYGGQGKCLQKAKGSVWQTGESGTFHKRHRNQKSNYTFCIKQPDGELLFCPHREVFEAKDVVSKDPQDMLTKICIPSSLRGTALRDLFQRGITPEFLYGSKDSKVLTSAMKCLDGLP